MCFYDDRKSKYQDNGDYLTDFGHVIVVLVLAAVILASAFMYWRFA
jgi:hypothetical protein